MKSLVFFYGFVIGLRTVEAGRSEANTLHECSLLQVLRRILKRHVWCLGTIHEITVPKISLIILDDEEIFGKLAKKSQSKPFLR